MAGTRSGARPVVRLVVALSLALGSVGAALGAPTPATALSKWTGGIDLYRNGTFTTQKSWLWCTAAGVQIMSNMVDGRSDHSASSQSRYFDWMRSRNRYDLPKSAGVDPEGWTAGLRRFVDDRYRLTVSASFDGALRLAARRMRLTNLPVAVTVSHGNHGWVLTGFTATADPARTKSFAVTSVRVVGPLYGLQSKNGYDMKPNTKLTTAQFKRFFTPWKYAPKKMIWDGKYVSIQPVPASTGGATLKPTPAPAPAATPVPTPTPAPYDVLAALRPTRLPTPTPQPLAVVPVPSASPPARPDQSTGQPVGSSETPAFVGPLAVGLGVVVVLFGLVVAGARRVRPPRSG